MLEERRKALKDKATAAGVKLTPLAFFIRAAVLALKEFPDFNSSLTEDGTGLVHKKYWHIGFAADTPQGLVVPVIRDADQKDLYTIARELGTQSEKARNGKLTANEMQGGTFTISSLGGIGGTDDRRRRRRGAAARSRPREIWLVARRRRCITFGSA